MKRSKRQRWLVLLILLLIATDLGLIYRNLTKAMGG